MSIVSDAPTVTTRTLEQVIAFNKANAAEMPFFGQELFEEAAKTKGLSDPEYRKARAESLKAASEAIDGMLKQANAAVLVTPSYGPAWLSDTVHGDQYGGPSSSQLPAIAGYPNLTVPMELVELTHRAALAVEQEMWAELDALEAWRDMDVAVFGGVQIHVPERSDHIWSTGASIKGADGVRVPLQL